MEDEMGLVRSALSAAKGTLGRGQGEEHSHYVERILRDEIEHLRRRIDQLERRLRAIEPEPEGRFHADMTLAEIQEAHPGAGEVLTRFHLGGCASCAVSTTETLRQGTELHQVDLNSLLGDLNALP